MKILEALALPRRRRCGRGWRRRRGRWRGQRWWRWWRRVISHADFPGVEVWEHVLASGRDRVAVPSGRVRVAAAAAPVEGEGGRHLRKSGLAAAKVALHQARHARFGRVGPGPRAARRGRQLAQRSCASRPALAREPESGARAGDRSRQCHAPAADPRRSRLCIASLRGLPLSLVSPFLGNVRRRHDEYRLKKHPRNSAQTPEEYCHVQS